MNPIRIKEYTLCVAVSGDHRGAAGNLLECPAYSLDAQTRARVVEDDYLVAMDIARGSERAEVIETCADNGSRPGCPAEDGARRNDPGRQPGAKVAFSLADALLARGPWQTGYDAQVMPSRFVHVKRCEKPIAAERIAAALFG